MNYRLVEREVSPEDMMLDPNNPRLRKDDFKTQVVDSAVICSDIVQNSLLKRICTEEHAVEPLMISIKNQGFIQLDAMLAKKLNGTSKFLIVEGNRRTAAIKNLLRTPQRLTANCRASLQKIPLKEIICSNKNDEQEVIDSIVALRHISGPKDWQPMQRAYAVFSSYARQYSQRYRSSSLAYSDRVMREVSFMLAQKVAKVREEVYIFFIFTELQNAGYAVRSDHYSLIQLMVSKPRLASEYFDYHRQGFRISSMGLEKFNELCIDEQCPIKNPKDFRGFYRIFQQGNAQDLAAIENGARSIDLVLGDIRDRNMESIFLTKSSKILEMLQGLQISSFKESGEEAEVIFKIKALIDRRLWPLAAKVLEIEIR